MEDKDFGWCLYVAHGAEAGGEEGFAYDYFGVGVALEEVTCPLPARADFLTFSVASRWWIGRLEFRQMRIRKWIRHFRGCWLVELGGLW